MKNKVVFISLVALHFFLGLVGLFAFDYMELQSQRNFLLKNIWLLIFIALALGIANFIFFTKAFPKGYQRQNMLGKILIPIALCIIVFFLNRGAIFLLNSFYSSGKLTISGKIIDKYFEKGTKGGKTYYIKLYDSNSKIQYTIRTSKKAYQLGGEVDDYFSKEFTIGLFGIIYKE